jgi:hypothetical protein
VCQIAFEGVIFLVECSPGKDSGPTTVAGQHAFNQSWSVYGPETFATAREFLATYELDSWSNLSVILYIGPKLGSEGYLELLLTQQNFLYCQEVFDVERRSQRRTGIAFGRSAEQ